jgi:hypothetical protein
VGPQRGLQRAAVPVIQELPEELRLRVRRLPQPRRRINGVLDAVARVVGEGTREVIVLDAVDRVSATFGCCR